eukprot:Gb_09215 [translate_table: standard]
MAKATSPSMANLPFHISTREDIIAWDLLYVETPFYIGINEANDNNTALRTNHDTPPLTTPLEWWRGPENFDSNGGESEAKDRASMPPLEFVGLFKSRRKQCTQPDRTNCCEAVLDLVRILLISRMDHISSFLLPDKHTAAVCVDALKANLEARSVAPKGLEDCKPDFALSGSCNNITNLARFEKAVDTMPMHKYCKGVSGFDFQCHQCVRAMAFALRQLQIDASRSGEKKTSCDLYVMLYVGGVINVCNNLGPDAAYCLQSVQNLSELASPTDGSDEIPQENFKSSERIKIALWISIPVGAMFILLLAIYASLKKRRQSQMLGNRIDLEISSFIFSFSDIKESTGSFSTSNVIGEGGFGTVYKGILPDGSLIAVKKLKDSATKADQVFRHEVQVISSIKHRNLLTLKGYCICHGKSDRPQHFMVYDFMANGSLADYLFKGNNPDMVPALQDRRGDCQRDGLPSQ